MNDLTKLSMQELQILYGKLIAEFTRRNNGMSVTTVEGLLAGIESAKGPPVDLGTFSRYAEDDK